MSVHEQLFPVLEGNPLKLTRYLGELGVDSSSDHSQQIGAVQHGALGHAAHLLVVCGKGTEVEVNYTIYSISGEEDKIRPSGYNIAT